MAITNFGMPFNAHRAQKYDLRTRPSKYAQSELRNWRFEQSEGIRPAAYYGVYKYLPVQLYDTTTEDYVVIPKGRIVSALSIEDSTPVSGMVSPSGAGSINIGYEATEAGGSIVRAQIDDDYFGYDMHINSLLVPCNGGVTCTGWYTTYDETAETITASGTAEAGTKLIIPRNCPIGVVYHDWYQDIAGKYLNYRMHTDGGHVLTDWFVEVPYYKYVHPGTYYGVHPQYSGLVYSNWTKWYDINSQYTYLTVDQTGGDTFRNGMFVQSDAIGNYKLQAEVTNSGGLDLWDAYTQPKTVQTVGKIIEIDCRWPKDGLEDVQTYPRSGMPGTQTAGMPKFLFDFVYDCIRIGNGTAPTVEGVYNAIRSGAFGVARIQLLVS